jgi:hypothetical protein
MQLTSHRSSASGDTGISFPKLECWNTVIKVAAVTAETNKKRVLCRISLESLRDEFGASEEEPMRLVAQHRKAVQDTLFKVKLKSLIFYYSADAGIA